ncbi:MAG: drug/metabolite transporter (DMT)-like permease [Bacteroidia bacterium]|jgi:drug/metabolite transporter (DMT)-like permease
MEQRSIKTPPKVHLALFGVALIYGGTYSIAKGVMPQYLGPSGFVFLRIATAAVLFNLVAWLKGFEKLEPGDLMKLAIAGFFGVAGNMMFFFNGLSRTTATNASTLMLTAPIFVVIFSLLLLKTKIYWHQIAGILIAAIGAMLLIGGEGIQIENNTLFGDAMIIVNAISFAFYLVYVKQLLVKYEVITITRYTFIFGIIYTIPFAFNDLLIADYGSFPASIWASLAFVAVMTTFVAYLLNAWAVKYAMPAVVGSYIYLQPIIATFIAVLFAGEMLSVKKVIFALLIFVGVYLVSSFKVRKKVG